LNPYAVDYAMQTLGLAMDVVLLRVGPAIRRGRSKDRISALPQAAPHQAERVRDLTTQTSPAAHAAIQLQHRCAWVQIGTPFYHPDA
jgi:hypothetical protein